MPTASPISRDVALEAHVFWHKFKTPIAAALVIVLVGAIGFAGYRLYSERRDSAGSALLSTAKKAPDFEQIIALYPNTPAGAAAYLLLAEAQRNERKFTESNTTLQLFIDKNPDHELVSTARIAIAANLESMGKTDEALSMYQEMAAKDPKNFNAPLALLSQVRLLKAKNQTDAARRVCEQIIVQYPDSFRRGEAMQELRSLKRNEPEKRVGAASRVPPGGANPPPMLARPSSILPNAPPSAPTPIAMPSAPPAKPTANTLRPKK